MNVLAVVLIALLVISGSALVAFVLLHSGKGTGVNEAMQASLFSTTSGTSVIEKNLDRITVGCAVVFIVCLIALMVVFPTGTISG